ncbi:MAG: PEGA domain-containing protein [Gammaproteobacteria bacterium]
MNLEVVVSDIAGTRTYKEQDLPLHIGTGGDADVRIPGAVAKGDIAQIGMLDGRLFVQVPRQGNVTVNDEQITATRWLEAEDQLRVAGVIIECAVAGEQLSINVPDQDIEYETAPPELQESADTQADISVIRPKPKPEPATQLADEQDRLRFLRQPVYIALGLLITAILYMFTAVTIVIGSEQGEVAVSLPNSWFTPGWDGRYLLWPGDYEVALSAEGYLPFSDTIEVVSGERQEFNFQLQEKPGRVQLVTRPSTDMGEVWIDGEPVGELSEDDLLLTRGKHELRIRSPRFLEYVAMIEVEGLDKAQTITAELVPGWADVTVPTEPQGAVVMLGEETMGETPGPVEIMAGTHRLIIRKPGYRTEQRTLSVIAGQQERLPLITLEEAGGLIRLTSIPSGSAVTLNGIFAGNTPIDLEVAKGKTHEVRLSRTGYNTAVKKIQVPDGTPVDSEIRLSPRLGSIGLQVSPADAELFINGKSYGRGNRKVELLAVSQRLELRKPGYESWVRSVTPKPGLPQNFDVLLLTPEQAKIAAMPKTLNTSLGQTLQLVEPGEFVMGAPRREQGRRPNEVNRPVRLTRWFYMSREEVSNKEFREFKPRHTSGAQKYRELAFDSSPVVMISWSDAVAYCNWLSERDGLMPAYVRDGKSWKLAEPVGEGYRLPTEAEWAWVARFNAGQGNALKYPWGQGMPPPNNSGNYADMAAEDVASSTINGYNDGFPVTSPGGAFPANTLGIYDLGGNVAEWVNDRYSVSRNSAETLIDPTGPTEGQYHVIRGSSWRQSSISELRLAYRDFGEQGRLDVGFRIARYAKPPEQ